MTNHDKIQLVHDALAECKNSDKLYLLIHEHYQDATWSCSRELRTNCERLIGALVIQAIADYEVACKKARTVEMPGDSDYEKHLLDQADAKVTEMREQGIW